MSESTRPGITINGVRDIINSKAWYGLDPSTGAFNWKASVSNIARDLSLDLNDTEAAITEAFTPDCLSQVNQRKIIPGFTHKTPLLAVLNQMKLDPHIWTVGDVNWQTTKFVRTGASKLVRGDHYHCATNNKESILKDIIDRSANHHSHFVVVDDKQSNIDLIVELASHYRLNNITIDNYHMKLRDPSADATAFYQWLLEQIKYTANKPGLILDFDGVVADTDGTLFGPAVDNLFALIAKR